MSEEMENKVEGTSQEQGVPSGENSREGYRQSGYTNYRSQGRSPRPRIQGQRSYTPRSESTGDGFRPDGFGGGLQQDGARHPYRPRTNSYGTRGYRQRYGNGEDGGGRPRYNSEGGYRQSYGGYRERYGNSEDGGYHQQHSYRPQQTSPIEGEGTAETEQPRQGGYQPRQGYQPHQSYRPRYNGGDGSPEGDYQQGGYQPRQGYQRQDGYQGRQGGYGNRSYQQRGYGNRGGYNNYGHQGGRSGGYRQRTADYDPNAKYSQKKRIEYSEAHIDPNAPIRLNKFLANAGICSRREADEFIQAGVISVNGTVVTELGTKVMRSDVVKFHDDKVSLEKKVYVLLNKPKDCVTTSDDPQQRKTVMDLVKDVCPERIYPVGRLDRNTTGVLLLTNDGDLASKLTHPKFLKKKVYHVTLDKGVTLHDLQKITEGITLEDGDVHADAAEYAHPTDKAQVGIEIHSGKNRIVRRIFESLGYRVIKLDRTQFAGLTKKNLRRGDWRFLSEKEVEMLRMGAFE